MKTLHVTNSWSETSGGIATFYRALMDAANRRKQRMVLVVPAASDGEKHSGEYAHIYEVAAPKARLNPVYRVIYPNQFLFPGGKLREILKREEPDLVEINDKYSMNYLGPLLRLRLMPELDFRPVVVGLSCERMDVNFGTYLRAGIPGQAFCAWYMRHIYFPFFDHHVAISEETAEELLHASEGHLIPRGVFELPMGVDCETFSSANRSDLERGKLLRSVGAPDSAALLLYVGRMVPEKNLPLLLETVEELSRAHRECRLLIAGDGISREAFLSEALKRVGARVHWLGHIADREKLAKLYANCDFFLHPNPREPFGIAPLEAMASGAVLVAPDSGGVQTYANSTNAVLSKPNGTEFASSVISLLNDSVRREALINAAIRTAQTYSWKAVTDRYFDLYENLRAQANGLVSLQELSPKYVSTDPSRVRGVALSRASKLASKLYSMSVRHAMGRSIRKGSNSERGGEIAGPLNI